MHRTAEMTAHERRVGSRYVWEFSAAMVCFLVMFLVLPRWWDTEPGTVAHLARVLAPGLPVIWIAVTLWRHVRRVDERQRVVLVRSLAFGFAVAMISACVIALLEGGEIDVPGGEWIIFILGMTGWGIATMVNALRGER